MNKQADRPNILLIMADQMRGDCLGAAGHPDVKTPYLDTLATRGQLFTRTYACCPSCIPSRAALLTGQSQRTHGRTGYEDGVPFRYEHYLSGELSKAGYYTQCVGKMHVHPLRNLCGFDNIELHDGALGYYRRVSTPAYEYQSIADDYFHDFHSRKGIDRDQSDTGIWCNSWVARPWPYEEELHPTNWVTSRSIDFLRRRDRDKPFFLMASYVRPHPPFDAPQCFFDMYKDMPLRPPAVGDWEDEETYLTQGRIIDSPEGIADPELIRQAQIGYYACITHLDHQIGRLLNALQDYGVYNNTVILFVSDHGELLGDHHMYRKSRPYEGSAHVPLIFCGAPLMAKSTVRQNCLCEIRDIMPTLLDIAGVPIPESVEGMSLLPVIRGETPEWRTFLHGEHAMGDTSPHFIVSESDKYIWHSRTGREQYFDLVHDRDELHDLIDSPAHAERISALRECLIHSLSGSVEGYVQDGRLVPGRKPLNTQPFLRTEQA